MEDKELKEKIEKISRDDSISVDERLELILGLSYGENEVSYDSSGEEKKKKLREEELIFSGAKDLVREHNHNHERDLTLMQLYVLLAETYDDLYDYRPMRKLDCSRFFIMTDLVWSGIYPRVLNLQSNQ